MDESQKKEDAALPEQLEWKRKEQGEAHWGDQACATCSMHRAPGSNRRCIFSFKDQWGLLSLLFVCFNLSNTKE